jgi:hypothetical protein
MYVLSFTYYIDDFQSCEGKNAFLDLKKNQLKQLFPIS